MEGSLRRTLVAVRLARLLGQADAEVADVLYTSLLQHLGCTAFAHESGQTWGEDDIALTRVALKTDFFQAVRSLEDVGWWGGGDQRGEQGAQDGRGPPGHL